MKKLIFLLCITIFISSFAQDNLTVIPEISEESKISVIEASKALRNATIVLENAMSDKQVTWDSTIAVVGGYHQGNLSAPVISYPESGYFFNNGCGLASLENVKNFQQKIIEQDKLIKLLKAKIKSIESEEK